MKKLRGGRPIVDFELLKIVAYMLRQGKQRTFKISSSESQLILFKDHHVLVFDLTSMQDATEEGHYPEKIGEPLRLEINLTFPIELVTELVLLGERMSPVAVRKLGVVEKII